MSLGVRVFAVAEFRLDLGEQLLCGLQLLVGGGLSFMHALGALGRGCVGRFRGRLGGLGLWIRFGAACAGGGFVMMLQILNRFVDQVNRLGSVALVIVIRAFEKQFGLLQGGEFVQFLGLFRCRITGFGAGCLCLDRSRQARSPTRRH